MSFLHLPPVSPPLPASTLLAQPPQLQGTDALAQELARRGLRARPYQRALLVPIAGISTYDAVRDSVAALGLPLSRMEQRRHQVEEIFRDAAQPGQDTQLETADAY